MDAGVTLTIPVFDGFRTRGKVAQARAERNKAAQDRIALENRIRLEAKEGVDRLNVARTVLEAAALNVNQAQRALEHDPGQLPARRGHHAGRARRPGRPHPGREPALQGLYEHANARATLRYVMAQDPLDRPAAARPPRQETLDRSRRSRSGRRSREPTSFPSSCWRQPPPPAAGQPRPTCRRRRARCRCARRRSSSATWRTRCSSRARCVRGAGAGGGGGAARLLRVLKDEGARVAAGEIAGRARRDRLPPQPRARPGRPGRGGGEPGPRRRREGARGQPAQDGRHHGQGPPVRAGRTPGRGGVAGPGPRGDRHRGRAALAGRRCGRPSRAGWPGATPTRAPCSPPVAPLFTLVDDSALEFRASRALGRLRQGACGRIRWTSRWTRPASPDRAAAWRA